MNNRLRKEEYAPAAQFLKTSFAQDRAALALRFPEYTAAYQTAFESKIAQVVNLETGVVATENQKQATSDLYDKADFLNNELNFITSYFKRADLDSKMVSKVKTDLNKYNIEGACLKIQGLKEYIVAHHVVLESKGMAASFPTELETIKTYLTDKNVLQNSTMNQLKTLHNANKGTYNELYAYITSICEVGKLVFKYNPKADEYTITKLIGRMRSSHHSGDTPPPPAVG